MKISEAVARIEASSSPTVLLDTQLQEFGLEDFAIGLAQVRAHVSDIEAKREFLAWWDEDEDWLDPDWDAPLVEQTLEALHVFANVEPKVEIHLPQLQLVDNPA